MRKTIACIKLIYDKKLEMLTPNEERAWYYVHGKLVAFDSDDNIIPNNQAVFCAGALKK